MSSQDSYQGWQAPPQSMEWLPVLEVTEPTRQRRLTVLLRLLLLIPHLVVLFVLNIIAVVVVVVGWFCALVLGRLPGFAHRYLAAFLAYQVRVSASAMLLVDRYPPFALGATDFPVQIELRQTRLNRFAVFFRLLLAIPAMIIQGLLESGWWTVGLINWLVVLILGRTPAPQFQATAAILRYTMRYDAYMLLLTSAYPKRLFGDPADADAYPQAAARTPVPVGTPAPDLSREYDPAVLPEPIASQETHGRTCTTHPLAMSSAGKVLLAIYLVIGIISSVLDSTVYPAGSSNTNGTTTTSSAATSAAVAVSAPDRP